MPALIDYQSYLKSLKILKTSTTISINSKHSPLTSPLSNPKSQFTTTLNCPIEKYKFIVILLGVICSIQFFILLFSCLRKIVISRIRQKMPKNKWYNPNPDDLNTISQTVPQQFIGEKFKLDRFQFDQFLPISSDPVIFSYELSDDQKGTQNRSRIYLEPSSSETVYEMLDRFNDYSAINETNINDNKNCKKKRKTIVKR